MKSKLGYTLIEILVVIGILAIVLAITLIAVNPASFTGKANDVALRAAVQDIDKAASIYFTSEKAYPWEKNDLCRAEIEAGGEYSSMGACIQEMTGIDSDDLSENDIDNYEKIHVSKCKDQAVMCYIPPTKEIIEDAKYDKWGVVKPGCPGTSRDEDCYWCKRVKHNEVCEHPPGATPSATLTPSTTPIPVPAQVSCIPGDTSPLPPLTLTTPIPTEPLSDHFSAYCMVRGQSTRYPGYNADLIFNYPDIGPGYAMRLLFDNYPIENVFNFYEHRDISRTGIYESCTTPVFEDLMKKYCTVNDDPAYWEYVVYRSDGNYTGNGWADQQDRLVLKHCSDYCPAAPPTPTPTYASLPSPIPIPTPVSTTSGILSSIGDYAIDDAKFFQTYALFTYDPPPFEKRMIDASFRPDFGGVQRTGKGEFVGGYPPEVDADTIFNVQFAGSGPDYISDEFTRAWTSITYKYKIGYPYARFWKQYREGCGKNIYWRVVEFPSYEETRNSTPIYTGVIDCETKVGALDNTHDPNNLDKYEIDINNDGTYDILDGILLDFMTITRSWGWEPPE